MSILLVTSCRIFWLSVSLRFSRTLCSWQKLLEKSALRTVVYWLHSLCECPCITIALRKPATSLGVAQFPSNLHYLYFLVPCVQPLKKTKKQTKPLTLNCVKKKNAFFFIGHIYVFLLLTPVVTRL